RRSTSADVDPGDLHPQGKISEGVSPCKTPGMQGFPRELEIPHGGEGTMSLNPFGRLTDDLEIETSRPFRRFGPLQCETSRSGDNRAQARSVLLQDDVATSYTDDELTDDRRVVTQRRDEALDLHDRHAGKLALAEAHLAGRFNARPQLQLRHGLPFASDGY